MRANRTSVSLTAILFAAPLTMASASAANNIAG
jgi:hypothetical protein